MRKLTEERRKALTEFACGIARRANGPDHVDAHLRVIVDWVLRRWPLNDCGNAFAAAAVKELWGNDIVARLDTRGYGAGAGYMAYEMLVDWLRALPEIDGGRMISKLYKLTFIQAVEHAVRWHERLAKRTAKDIAEDVDGVEPFMDVADGHRWVKLTTPAALDRESAIMRHCVGHGGYDSFRTTILSLRDGDNIPHVTVEWDESDNGLIQVQGKANGPIPPACVGAVRALIKKLRPGAFGFELASVRMMRTQHGVMAHEEIDLLDELIVDDLVLTAEDADVRLPSMVVAAQATFDGYPHPLPEELDVGYLKLIRMGTAVLPAKSRIGDLRVNNCPHLVLPDGLTLDGHLWTDAETIPATIQVNRLWSSATVAALARPGVSFQHASVEHLLASQIRTVLVGGFSLTKEQIDVLWSEAGQSEEAAVEILNNSVREIIAKRRAEAQAAENVRNARARLKKHGFLMPRQS